MVDEKRNCGICGADIHPKACNITTYNNVLHCPICGIKEETRQYDELHKDKKVEIPCFCGCPSKNNICQGSGLFVGDCEIGI